MTNYATVSANNKLMHCNSRGGKAILSILVHILVLGLKSILSNEGYTAANPRCTITKQLM